MIKKTKVILVVVLLVVLLFQVISDPPPVLTEEEFQKQLTDAGIDNSIVSGCVAGCSYDGKTGTLSLIAGATMESVPQDVKKVTLNGGAVNIVGGRVSGFGSYTQGTPPELSGGLVSYDPNQRSTNLNFDGSVISFSTGESVSGKGKIINGILEIDKGVISQNNKGIPVENVRYLGVGASYTGNSNKVEIYSKDNSKIGGEQDYLTVEPGRSVLIGFSNEVVTVEVGDSWNEQEQDWDLESNPPSIIVNGKPTLKIDNEWGPEPAKITIGGEEHTFFGDLELTKGQLSIPPDPLLDQIHMVDGVYVNPKKKEVDVYFDDSQHEGEYISLGDKLRAGGEGFSLALSEKGVGQVLSGFEYDFPVANKYANNKIGWLDYSPFRLVVDFPVFPGPVDHVGHGDIVIDPETRTIQSSGDVVVTNGVNEITYWIDSEDNKQKYNYKYVGCKELACAELDYTMVDGGEIDVVLETNSFFDIPSGKKELEVYFGGETEKRKLNLHTDRTYVLAYRGGGAAAGIVGEDLAKKEWGHAGVMYYKDGDWRVVEATGRSTEISDIKHSFFNEELHGIWQVNDDDGNPINSQKVISFAEKLVGAKYDLNPFTPLSVHCSEVVCKSVEAATGKDFESKVVFKDIPGGASSLPPDVVEKSITVGPALKTPRYVVESPNLEEIYVVPLEPIK